MVQKTKKAPKRVAKKRKKNTKKKKFENKADKIFIYLGIVIFFDCCGICFILRNVVA